MLAPQLTATVRPGEAVAVGVAPWLTVAATAAPWLVATDAALHVAHAETAAAASTQQAATQASLGQLRPAGDIYGPAVR
ncbi:MAG TPA: hypothetical protein VG165_08270 [Solirubrobacteraceae bacterium]|nr:hypothetical protein [Solirubrobacteraceae bacterium]